jgi:outer membrane protein
MKKTTTALALALASTNVAALPLIDFWVGGYSWNTAYEGSVSATSSGQPIDLSLDNTLQLEDSYNNVIWAAFEHPVPVLPNIQIKQTSLETTGMGSFDQSFTFGGETYNQNLTLDSNLNLNHTDLTLYWGLPLPIVTVDFGLNIRQFDGDLMINQLDSNSNIVNSGSTALDAPIPMAFARVGGYLPFTGLSLMAEANYIGYGETNHMDYQIVARYTLPIIPVLDVNIEAGYRSFQLNIDPTDFDGDEDDLTADIDMSGVFVGLSFHL